MALTVGRRTDGMVLDQLRDEWRASTSLPDNLQTGARSDGARRPHRRDPPRDHAARGAGTSDPRAAALVEVFDSMLAKAYAALEGHEVVRAQLRAALGDQSCLVPLTERLRSLDENCLTELRAGLGFIAEGDLTVADS